MMVKPMVGLVCAGLLAGCLEPSARTESPPANAGYCASLALLLDSVDPRMAAAARADMARARCAAPA